MSFNDRDYTMDSIIKQLGLIELHSKDGSALEGGCACIETKHLYLLEGLSEEGVGFAMSVEEKEFYTQLGDLARQVRKLMEKGDFSEGLHGVMRKVMKKSHPKPLRHNPYPRKYLPHGLTACEQKYPSVRKKLSHCISTLEPREEAGEIESAVAVCRASIKCPP